MATKKNTTSLSGVSDNTASNLAKYQNGYTESDKVKNAYNDYTTLKNNAPSEYQSAYTDQINNIYDKIMNREKFSYDLNSDALYNQAKEQYVQLGRQAMNDTIGTASAMTGGYGNSYATSAGNQAYQQYLTQLNDKVSDYYQLALDRYNAEGDDLANQYSIATERDNTDYNRYRDTVSDYNDNLDRSYNVYNNERTNDYNTYSDALSYWNNMASAENSDYWTKKNYDYQASQDAADRAYDYASLNAKYNTTYDSSGTDSGSDEEEEQQNLVEWKIPKNASENQAMGGSYNNFISGLDTVMNNANKVGTDEEAQKASTTIANSVENAYKQGYLQYEQAREILKKYGLA